MGFEPGAKHGTLGGLTRRGVGLTQTFHAHGSAFRSTSQRVGFRDAEGEPFESGLDGKEHRTELLSRGLHQLVVAEAQQLAHLLRDGVVVTGVRQTSISPGSGELRAQIQVDHDSLRSMSLVRPNANDALDLEPLNLDRVHLSA